MRYYTLKELEQKFQNLGVKYVGEVLTYIKNNVDAFKFAKRDLNDMRLYLILKNTGADVFFKTINEMIVYDKLDVAYSNSRELLGLENWNVRKVLRIRAYCRNEEILFSMRSITYKSIRNLSFNVIEPATIDYVVYGDGNFKKVSVSDDIIRGMTIGTLQESIRTLFHADNVNQTTLEDKYNCYVVDFS